MFTQNCALAWSVYILSHRIAHLCAEIPDFHLALRFRVERTRNTPGLPSKHKHPAGLCSQKKSPAFSHIGLWRGIRIFKQNCSRGASIYIRAEERSGVERRHIFT